MKILEMNSITKTYGSFKALDNISFDLSAGEIVCFLGPNGAGKTTAISIMLGLKKATSGTVSLFGESPNQAKSRDRIGVMLQESGVPDSLKVSELINLIRATYSYALPTDEILKKADLLEKQNARISTLSGGQKQRLYFALAIAGDPDIVFLDEPTVAMDVQSRQVFWQVLRDFAKLGKSILFSTHYLEEADENADRIIVINKGQIIAQGSPTDIKAVVADKSIRFKTDITSLEAKNLGINMQQDGEYSLIYTQNAEETLADLFAKNIKIKDLSVTTTDLEAAFLSLTKEQK